MCYINNTKTSKGIGFAIPNFFQKNRRKKGRRAKDLFQMTNSRYHNQTIKRGHTIVIEFNQLCAVSETQKKLLFLFFGVSAFPLVTMGIPKADLDHYAVSIETSSPLNNTNIRQRNFSELSGIGRRSRECHRHPEQTER